MTNQEFSDEFDVLYNNIMSNQAPGLDEYEKSVFLTKAQDEIVKAYFNPRLNKVQQGFDGNETRQIDFSMLIKTTLASEVTNVTRLYPTNNSKFFAVPNRTMMFINETLMVTRDSNPKYLTVIPLEYTEYNRLMSKPFKRPTKNQAWRVITNTVTNSTTTKTDYATIATIIATSKDKEYKTIFDAINGKTLTFSGSGDSFTLTDISNVTFTATEKANLEKYINYNVNSEQAVVEIIPGPTDIITSYTVRYVARPRAIILSTLDGVSIDGQQNTQTCELDPILHHEILQRAVELAKAAYTGDLNSQIALGQSSETEKGIVAQSR